MKATCQNCQKEYQPKRRSSKFCSTACRVSAWEKAQPLASAASQAGQELGTDEVYLARKLDAYAREGGRLLVQMKSAQGGTEAIKKMVELVQMLAGEHENSVVQSVLKPRPFVLS